MTHALLDRPIPIEDDATRRQFLVGAAAAALLAGSDRAEPASSPGGGFPVTIAHKYGSTEIPTEPKRVVTVGIREPDSVLALGVRPVAVTDFYGRQPFVAWPWAAAEWGDDEPMVVPELPLDYERIAALRPDVIIGTSSGMTEEDFALLTQIAPTVAQSGTHPNYSTPWREELPTIARILGKERLADELVADLEARVAESRSRHPRFASAIGVMLRPPYEEGVVQMYAPDSPPAEVLNLLGFQAFPVTEEMARENAFFSISEERLDLVDHDLLVWLLGGAVDRAVVEALPLYGQLTAAREGRDVFVEDDAMTYAVSLSTVLSLPYVLDGLVPKLAAAVDGDPTTEVPS